jgi:tetratricopeptide (TPR) repeat protein
VAQGQIRRNLSADRVPESIRAEFTTGLLQLRADQVDDAIATFSRIIEKHPTVDEAYAARAQAYRRQEKLAKTVEEKDRAALGYISDERHLTRKQNRAIWDKIWQEQATPQVVGLLVFYAAIWLVVLFFWCEQGGTILIALVMFLIVHGLIALVPSNEWRAALGVASLLLTIGVLVFKPRNQVEVAQSPHGNSPLDSLTMDGAIKICPVCDRQLGLHSRICPRCYHRF